MKRLEADIAELKLQADKVLEPLFVNAKLHKTTQEIIYKARVDLGKPPGKKYYGHAVNW